MKTGGELIVDCLKAQGVERVFSVPGESYLAVLDALFECGIENVVARHEGGASMMAEADGKITGRPGVAFVTRGPGATNASSGVHVAKQDSTPMVLFVGQIGRRMRGRDAFQEVDYRQMFSDLAKWVEEIDHADRIPEVINHAWHIAMSGRPGPVVIALPEDMLREAADVMAGPRVEVAAPSPSIAEIARFEALLRAAKQPLIVLGGSRWRSEDVAKCEAWAERTGLPVGCTFRRQYLFDNEHPNYVGEVGFKMQPALKTLIDEADLLVFLGCRFSEVPSQGFELLSIPKPKQRLVHIHPGAEELGRIYAPDLAINATPGAFLDTVFETDARFSPPIQTHEAYRAYSTPEPAQVDGVDNGQVMAVLRDRLPKDAIFTNGAGNYAIWLQRYWRFCGIDSYVGPTSGSMGYGLPAAIAAKARHPERMVVCFAGDGCFQMSMSELGTAAQAGLKLLVLVFDNAAYGTIRMHQEMRYPERVSGTGLSNPDFAAISRAYGAHGETVENSVDFGPALGRAIESGKLAVIHIKNDRDVLSPTARISTLRAARK